MNTREAAQRLADVLNALGAEGISVKAGAHGVLCLSKDADGSLGHVLPPDAADTAWTVEPL